ncbi:phage portal protein [Mycetocola miduiensis]|uniref:Phage portal protein, putative, A118 family n=1 Tax=Mycetocola miduiensis TaxID=995034 RepID=A0A1I5AVB5_9MICO|nr:phage portal protein [Mycetocola miduiensis]SFN66375.1 phage portal protein, putative, A118 family [Mycetocola miduiensis]
MALPEPNSAWPPPAWAAAYATYAENEAWYLGDVDKLTKVYQRNGATRPVEVRGQRNGGVVGAVSRFFWGRPVPAGQNRTRLHIPAPADLATLSSDLMFSEPPEVRIEGLTALQQARLDLIANSDGAHATFNEMGELKAALGATVIASEWDQDVADHVWLESYGVDVVIPEFRKKRLLAATMWTEYVDGNRYFRHLERHERGMIEHALYEGTADKIGRRVPLQDRPETEHIALIVDADSRILTGLDRLTVSYNKNMPTMAWRKKGELAAAGRSDFAQLHPLFDALDETWSSWMRDLKQGAGKVLVPQGAATAGGPGTGASFDTGQEFFVELNAPGEIGKVSFDKIQFDIRVEQHERTAYAIYREILRKAGYSPSAWGDYGANGAITATEIDDRSQGSERTRDKKALFDKQAIGEQASVALELDGLLFPGKGGGRHDKPITVEFPEVSQEDPEKRARTLQMLDAARSISTEARVRYRLEGENLTEPEILAEIERVQKEQGEAAPDPTTFTG